MVTDIQEENITSRKQNPAYFMLLGASFSLLVLLIIPENCGRMFLRNVSEILSNYGTLRSHRHFHLKSNLGKFFGTKQGTEVEHAIWKEVGRPDKLLLTLASTVTFVSESRGTHDP
jgi:lauroyl/myristoyl acyltransferase